MTAPLIWFPTPSRLTVIPLFWATVRCVATILPVFMFTWTFATVQHWEFANVPKPIPIPVRIAPV